jgi:hypothetical protein
MSSFEKAQDTKAGGNPPSFRHSRENGNPNALKAL